MEVKFEDIKNQESSNEEEQSNNTECLIGLSDDNTDYAEKFVQSSENHTLNRHTKHCIICCYYKWMVIPSSARTIDLHWTLKECISSGRLFFLYTRQQVVVFGMRRADVHCIPVQYVPTLHTVEKLNVHSV